MHAKHVLFLVLLTLTHFGQGQEPTRTIGSLETALVLAFEYNPDIEVYEKNMKKAEADWKAARSYRMLNISSTISGQDNRTLPTTLVPGEIFGQPGQVVETQFGQRYAFNAGISISKSLFDWQSRMQAKMAESDLNYQSARNEVFRQQLTQQVAYYYYGILIAEEALRLHTEDVELTLRIRNLSKLRQKQGLIDQATDNQSHILANNAQANRIQTERLLNEYRMMLRFTLGIPQEEPLQLSEQLRPEAFQEVVGELGENKELELSRSQLELSEWGVKMQKAADLPKLTLYSYIGQQQFRDDFGLSFESDQWFGNTYIGLSLNVPIFSGFRNRNQVKSATLEREISEQQLESHSMENQYADRILLYNYTQSQASTAIALDTYELYRENAELSLQKYDQGLIGLDQYLSVLEDQIRAENQYLNALTTLSNYYATIRSRNPS